MAKTAAKPTNLEAAMARLEEVVTLMNGECTLDESIALYTEAVKLIEYAGGRLDTARQKVEKLVAAKETDDGTV